MLTLGHISSSYLLAQVPAFFAMPLSPSEQILVVVSGYILDLDLLFAKKFVKNEAYHHLLPTHTPFFVLIISGIGFLFLKNFFSVTSLIFASLAMLLHLALDDFGYWFYKLGWQKISHVPQIFWLYPFDKRRKHFVGKWQNETNQGNLETIKLYITKATVNVVLEIILSLIAMVIFIKQVL